MRRRIIFFIGAGLIASILTLSLSGTVSFSSVVVSYEYSGVFFALMITTTTALQESRLHWDLVTITRFCVAALVLSVGPPSGLIAAGRVDRTLGSIGANGGMSSMIVAATAAIVLWALCLAVFLKIVALRWRTLWFAQATVLSWVIFAVVVGANFATETLWQISVFVPLFIISEQVGSAIFLGFATGRSDLIQQTK